MQLNRLLLAASLASSVVAAPPLDGVVNAVVSSAVCNAVVVCLRPLLVLRPGASNSASISSNCATFMTKTVTPCAVTSTSTVPTTIVGSPVTQTLTATVTSFSTNVNPVSSTIVTSFTVSSTLTVTTGSTVTSTQIQTVSTTVTSVQGSGHLQKRDEDVAEELQKRTTVAAQCSPVTSSATTIPGTYSTCGNTSRYYSACSCLGVTPGLKTLATPTVVSTVTTTQTSTPTVSVTSTTTLISVTQTTTTVVQQSSTTTTFLFTSTATSFATVQTTVTTTSTSTVVLPPFPTTFVIQAGTGPGTYGFIAPDQYTGLNGYTPNIALGTIPKQNAQLWQIANGNQLFTADLSRNTWAPTDGGVIIVIPPGDTADQEFYHLAAASLGAYASNVGGYVFTLANPQPNNAAVFAQDSNGNLFYNFRSSSAYSPVPALYAVPP